MNINKFCDKYKLGNVLNIKKLTGGIMHKMYKVETDKGIFAIKVLNKEVMKRPDAMDNFILSEKISNLAKDNNIPVANALTINDNFINELDDDYYMVFDYIDGKTLRDDEITLDHCKKVGNILGELHNLDYSKLGLEGSLDEDDFYVDWGKYTKEKDFDKMPYKEEYLNNYKRYYSLLKRVVDCKNNCINEVSICHMDMDSKNVMWQNNNPIVIDFESAKLNNPTRELIDVALNWSGFLSNNFDSDKFILVLKSYLKQRSIKHKRYDAICANLIGRFGWLDYNLKRSLEIINCDKEDKALAEKEVLKTIDEINRYIKLIGFMYDELCKLTKEEVFVNNDLIEKIINNNELLKGKRYKLINKGFTNAIYNIGNYIVRICTDVNNEQRFINEINFYIDNKDNKSIPKMYYYDTSKTVIPYYYEIIEKKDGISLYEVWPYKTEEEKEEIIKKIINIIKPFHDKKVEEIDFKKFIKDKITNLNANGINIDTLLDLCDFYFMENDLCHIHADLHFDNVLINNDEIILLDFERSMVGAIDYEFAILAQCKNKPYRWASAETDMMQTDYDYRNIVDMIKKNYPRLNSVKYLDERFLIYELIEDIKEYKYTGKEKLKEEINNKIKKLRR